MAGIYLHIPFCKTRCTYCDFYSSTKQELTPLYIDSIKKEMLMRKEYIGSEIVETIYLGGGTPSQLSYEQLDEIFTTIKDNFKLAEKMEITLEANPDDLSTEYLKQLEKLPINRLSIGIQTFQDDMLQKLNRRHTSEQAIEAVKQAQKHGFDNISIDLMYGLPGETLEDWKKDLQKAISLDIQHVSAYHLIYEENTPLFKSLQQGKIKEVEEEMSLSFFKELIKVLTENEFIHYEISNFAKPNKVAQHNTSYWLGKKYLGCGPSAHSFNGKTRECNTSTLSQYIEEIDLNKRSVDKEELSTNTRFNDLIITGLRTMWGVSLTEIMNSFGEEIYNYTLNAAKKHIKTGNLVLENNQLKLSYKGIFISDGIMSDLLIV